MGLFSRRTKEKLDPLESQAERLILTANLLEQQILFALQKQLEGDEFAATLEVDRSRWNIILTVAGFYVGVIALKGRGLPAERQERLIKTAFEKALEWNSRSGELWNDCRTTMEEVFEKMAHLEDYASNPRRLAVDSLGLWINVNLNWDSLTDARQEVGLAASRLLTAQMLNYWDWTEGQSQTA